MTGTVADIGDRKQAEEARVRCVLEASPEAMLVIGPEGRIRYANALCAASFGYPLAELAGMQAKRLAPGIEDGGGPDHVVAATRANGESFPAEVNLTPMQLARPAADHRLAARHRRAPARQRGAQGDGDPPARGDPDDADRAVHQGSGWPGDADEQRLPGAVRLVGLL
ncbi:PAS domain S-box protein [Massilia sp. B-10]|nr:PAS domain S-box protein [Massilia sp. B-10]